MQLVDPEMHAELVVEPSDPAVGDPHVGTPHDQRLGRSAEDPQPGLHLGGEQADRVLSPGPRVPDVHPFVEEVAEIGSFLGQQHPAAPSLDETSHSAA